MSITRIRPKADLIYGASGTRKTSNLGLMALYVWEKYHKRTRVITLDGGGIDVLTSLVEAEIVVPWVLIGRKKLTTNLIDLAMQGYWPKDIEDSESPLVSPTNETWQEIGGYGIEGLTSIGDNIIRILKRDKASLSQDPSYTYTEEAIEVDGKKRVIGYSGGNMTYFGFAQDQLYDFVMKSHVLPCEKVIWTALEGKGEEEGSRAPVYGPAIVGRKSTGKATQWFGNSLHIEQLISESYDEKTKQTMVIETPVLYTRTHAGKDKIPFPCKTRSPFQLATKMPDTFNPPDIAALYKKLDELNVEALAGVKKVSVNIVHPVVAAEGGKAAAAAAVATTVASVASISSPASSSIGTGEPNPLPAGSEKPSPAPVISPAKNPPVNTTSSHAFIPPRVTLKKP